MKLSVPLSALMSEAITGFCENDSFFYVLLCAQTEK